MTIITSSEEWAVGKITPRNMLFPVSVGLWYHSKARPMAQMKFLFHIYDLFAIQRPFFLAVMSATLGTR